MFFTKFPYRTNFAFASAYNAKSKAITCGKRTFNCLITEYAGGLTHLQMSHPETWTENGCLETLEIPEISGDQRLSPTKSGNFRYSHSKIGIEFTLKFGVSGTSSMFELELGPNPKFYGMGEKYFGVQELSGYRSKYYNTDVWSDFHSGQWGDSPSDPPYFTTPYLVVETEGKYFGLLLHNPYPAYMETPGIDESRVFVEWQRTLPNLVLGNEGGEPNLWVISGPSLAEVTQKLQKLVGVTPRPPLWSLGYHQSRWGYEGHDDLLELDKQFQEHEIPCSGLWLDLDYMDGYRVFKTSPKAFPKGPAVTSEVLAKNGRRIVPILDPGVKFEKGYSVYDDGHKNGVFCQNTEGQEFIGLVWPGETVFADYTIPKGRTWWTNYVKQFRRDGYGACWIDMNDPSTGPVDPTDMLFRDGTEPHNAHRNQFSLGMQMATRDGFLAASPNERPFILSRSGFIGTSKNAAIWTGDNISNYFYLKIAIPTAIGMSLSGITFSGPDIGGFGGNVSDGLMIDWMKACFLFPFCRNHSGKNSRNQEPFAFKKPVMKVLRHYIQLRYRLLPYLYNLYIQHETVGDPVLRPMLYHFPEAGLEKADDQFFIGDAILQAPFVVEDARSRLVTLPGSAPWFDANSGDWTEPGIHKVKNSRTETPLYFRHGSIIPIQSKTPKKSVENLMDVEFHIFLAPELSASESYTYVFDDGISFDYRSGGQSALEITVEASADMLTIDYSWTQKGAGTFRPRFVLQGSLRTATINSKLAELTEAKYRLTDNKLTAARLATQ